MEGKLLTETASPLWPIFCSCWYMGSELGPGTDAFCPKTLMTTRVTTAIRPSTVERSDTETPSGGKGDRLLWPPRRKMQVFTVTREHCRRRIAIRQITRAWACVPPHPVLHLVPFAPGPQLAGTFSKGVSRMRRRNVAIALFGLLLMTALCAAQQLSKRMTNKDVIEMVQLGLPDDLIIDKIQSAPTTDFDTSVVGLKALKQAK